METIEIKITVEKTSNPKINKVSGELCAGRGEFKAALTAEAKKQIEAVVNDLFPAKGA